MNFFKKTKIIATYGPSIQDEKKLIDIINLGVNVIRFNFSHLKPHDAKKHVEWVRGIFEKIDTPVAFLADLKGPEIRTNNQTYDLENGEEIFLISNETENHQSKLKTVKIDHPFLYRLVKKNQKISADDGFFEFKVIEIIEKKIKVKVINGGKLTSHKSIIVSGVDIELPIISKRDKENLDYIVTAGFSWIAASFISSAKDVNSIKDYLKKQKKDIPIISKIENSQGIKNLEEILAVSEGVMVARGDLGLEYPFEQVPILQEKIINKAKEMGKVVIVATQMLDSMINNMRPSRPEVSDISNAIRSKVDAVMLSGETAAGKYPVRSVEAMVKVIKESEKFYENQKIIDYQESNRLIHFCKSAIGLALALEARCIISITSQGKSPRYLSSFRSDIINVVATTNPEIFLKILLYYSVYPILMKEKNNYEKFISIIRQCKQKKILKKKDKFIHIFTHRSDRISEKFLLATNSIREEIVE